MSTDLPEKITVDLDRLDSEPDPKRKVPAAPFTAKIGDKVITLTDPADVDYRDVIALENPLGILKFVASEEDLDVLRTTRIKSRVLGDLFERFIRYYGFDMDAAGKGGLPF